MNTGRRFFNILVNYGQGEIYAHEMAILEENLDSTWRVDTAGDVINLPELSVFDNTGDSFKSKMQTDLQPSRFDPNISRTPRRNK